MKEEGGSEITSKSVTGVSLGTLLVDVHLYRRGKLLLRIIFLLSGTVDINFANEI